MNIILITVDYTRLYVRFDILLTCMRQLHDNIISLRGEAWAHKTRLTPPHFIEVSVPRH